MRLALFAPLLALTLLVGCSSPTTVTRIGSKTATIVALTQTEATPAEAQSIQTIAVMVKAVVGEGDLDTDALRLAILDALIAEFSGQQQLIYVAVADELLILILEEIANADDPLQLGEAGIYITAAALGVEQGATLYILLLETE